MRKHIGWIALDIDGTITDQTHHAPKEVVDFLHTLVDQGWEIVFLTGRTFSFGYSVVKKFDFSCYLAVQNGADILLMPQKEPVSRHYLDEKVISVLNQIYQNEREDFLLYAGYERGDFCYFRPARYSQKMQEHLQKIMALSPEPWVPLEDFNFEKGLAFPLAKCLGTKEAMQRVNALLQSVPELSATLIRDPLGEEIWLNLVTAKEATKGNALRAVRQIMGEGGPSIAAGDDLNDLSMLEAADVRIVMAHAPKEMHAMATILAEEPSSGPHPIIAALNQAITHAL